MITIADLMNLSHDERARMQKGLVRGMVIGAWASREPQLMKLLLNMAEAEHVPEQDS